MLVLAHAEYANSVVGPLCFGKPARALLIICACVRQYVHACGAFGLGWASHCGLFGQLPEYYELIKRPIDFETIRQAALDGEYTKANGALSKRFRRDVELLCRCSRPPLEYRDCTFRMLPSNPQYILRVPFDEPSAPFESICVPTQSSGALYPNTLGVWQVSTAFSPSA